MNPWGFAEKTFNMLSFYGPDVSDIFQESKELRARFDFVIEEVVTRILRDTSVPITLQTLAETQEYGRNKSLSKSDSMSKNFPDIESLAPTIAAVYMNDRYQGRKLDQEIINAIKKVLFEKVSYQMSGYIKSTIKPIGNGKPFLKLVFILYARWRFKIA